MGSGRGQDMRELKSIEEKILDRTLYLIGKKGTVNVPIRAIVQEAGVNISAINYYFRTKEELLRHVKQFYVDNVLSTIHHLTDEKLEDEERLLGYANTVMEYCIRFPGITVILKDAQEHADKDEMSRRILAVTQDMLEKLDEVLRRIIRNDGEQYLMKRLIFLSSIVHPMEEIRAENPSSSFLLQEEKRLEYIRRIIEMIRGKN